MSDYPFKKGDQIETVHGEKITVEDIRTTEPKTKKGVVIEEGRPYVLAMSGGFLTQFPFTKIKGYKKPEAAPAA